MTLSITITKADYNAVDIVSFVELACKLSMNIQDRGVNDTLIFSDPSNKMNNIKVLRDKINRTKKADRYNYW